MSFRTKLSRRKRGGRRRTRARAFRAGYNAVRTTKSRRRAVERKSSDVTFTTTVGNTITSSAGGSGNAFTHLLSGIATGSDYNQRIGRKVNIKDLILSYQVQIDEVSATATRFHSAVVLDKSPTGTLPTVSDIYDTYGLRVLENTPRYRVLSTRIYNLRASSDGSTTVQVDAKSFYRRIPVKQVATYSAETATLGSISGNAIYLICWSEHDVDCHIRGKCRLRFSEE